MSESCTSCYRLPFPHWKAVLFSIVCALLSVHMRLCLNGYFLLTGMNIPLAWECGEMRLGKERAEKEMNDSRHEAHWTPSIYTPTTSVHCDGEKPEIVQTSRRKPGTGPALGFSSTTDHVSLEPTPPCNKMKTPS